MYILRVLYDIQNSHPMRIPPSVSSILFSSSISSSGALLERPPSPLTASPPLTSLLSAIYFTKFSLSYGVTLVLEMFSKEHPRPDHPATCNYFLIYISRIETVLRDIRVIRLSCIDVPLFVSNPRVESFILFLLSFLFSFRRSVCYYCVQVGPFDNAISNLTTE